MYRRPAVTVIQEFVGLVPALASFSLPTCVIGPAYQLVGDDKLGTYQAAQQAYAYASLMPGAQVDIAALDPTDPFPATKMPIAVKMLKAVVQITVASTAGAGSGTGFTDLTPAQFAAVQAGDIVVVTTGPNAGRYIVKSKTDANTLALQSPLLASDAAMTYSVIRNVDSIALTASQFTASANAITLGATIEYAVGTALFPILSGEVHAQYRALRNDLAAATKEFGKLADVQAVFGVTQITPANPLAYGLSIQLQNTTTPVNGLGLNGMAVADEILSFQAAADVLARTEMYALVCLTQNTVVAQAMKSHVDGMSQPGAKKERVVIVNRSLITTETLVTETTTDLTQNGSRIIVNTQTDGSGVSSAASVLNDSTADQFMNVQVGDLVVVTGGTHATVGHYQVASIQSSNQLTVTGSIFTGACSDLAYYVVRQDGIAANGQALYDRNGSFISGGVAAGMILEIIGGIYAGIYQIIGVSDDKTLQFAQIPGITTLQTGVTYRIYRNLGKDEQASVLAGYSSSLGDRRVINVWPDSLEAPVGAVLVDVPGFYGGCAVGAMTTGLPTHQGFTNLSISGFLGLKHSSGYFTDAQLDVIAGGGTLIFAQDGDQQPLYVRHQLTTDRSAIKFQEYSITKNVDYIAKFLRQAFAPFVGKYNIVDTTFDELRGTAKATLTFLKDQTRLPRIGGVIRSGQLSSLQQNPAAIDGVLMRFSLDIPVPLNNLDITIEV